MPENNRKPRRRMSVGTIICASLAVIILAVCALLMIYTELSPSLIIYVALGSYLFALLLMSVIAIVRHRMAKGNFSDIKESIFGTISLAFIESLYMPVLICDEKGKIVWYNHVLNRQNETHGVLYGKYIDSICNATIEQIVQSGEEGTEVSFISASEIAEAGADVYLSKGYRTFSKGKTYYVTGDTLYNSEIFDDLPHHIDVVFCPINGVGNNMNAADAVRFCKQTGAKVAVPVHFGMFDDIDPAGLKVAHCVIPRLYEEFTL